MKRIHKVAGYVKLAKLWERSRTQALAYHQEYYRSKYAEEDSFELVDVYIDITGQKEIRRRPEMLRLIDACLRGNVDCIAAQTKGYLAANTREFCYLIKFLFESGRRIDLITEDDQYNINTLENADEQREALQRMANDYAALNPEDYDRWCKNINLGMAQLLEAQREGR